VIELVLPYPISANRYWQSFVPPGAKRALVHLSSEAKKFKKECAWRVNAAGVRKPLVGRLVLEVDLYPHRPLDWAKRARIDPVYWADTVQCIDLGNCEKVLSDALNGSVFVDDGQLHRIVLQRMDPDEHGERAVARISHYVTKHPQASLGLPEPEPRPEPLEIF
jgi:crossover junction endodeoxyribonuclease RusA